MLFSDNSVFDCARDMLVRQLSVAPACTQNPLPCDRWIARSALQKTIRRGEVELAQRALANLYQHDSYAVWRHLTIICLEDVGVGDVNLLTQLVAAKSDRKWRAEMGGDWPVLAGLVRSMALSVHCQAACDLLLRVTNDPAFESAKVVTLSQEICEWSDAIGDASHFLEGRAMAALAMSGLLLDAGHNGDVPGVFDLLGAEIDPAGMCVPACRQAWKISRNPMALLLPLIWQFWTACEQATISDDRFGVDPLPARVPGYALDQFTRVGNQVSRAYVSEDAQLRDLLERTGVPRAQFSRVFGDALFLIEGGVVTKRLHWSVADALRDPYRCLPSVAFCGQYLPEIIAHCQAKAQQIANVRWRIYPSPN